MRCGVGTGRNLKIAGIQRDRVHFDHHLVRSELLRLGKRRFVQHQPTQILDERAETVGLDNRWVRHACFRVLSCV